MRSNSARASLIPSMLSGKGQDLQVGVQRRSRWLRCRIAAPPDVRGDCLHARANTHAQGPSRDATAPVALACSGRPSGSDLLSAEGCGRGRGIGVDLEARDLAVPEGPEVRFVDSDLAA